VGAGGAGGTRFGGVELALLAAVSVVWGAAYVFIRQGIELGASPLTFAAARYALSAVGFAALAALRGDRRPPRRDLLVSAGVGGVLIIGLYGGLLYWGEQYTTGGYAAVLAATAPLLTVGLGFALLASERLGAVGLSGMGVGFVGATILVLPELYGTSVGTWQGPLFILAAMLSAACGTVLLRRVGRGRQSLWQIGTQFMVAAAILGVASIALPVGSALPLTTGVLVPLAILVAFSSLVGYFAYFTLHHRVGPVRANIVAYLAPLVGVGIGSGIYGEPFTVWEILGVGVVLAGVTLVLWESAHRPSGPATAVGPSPPGAGGERARSD
jgi:probable blue pigment (indigoidine) exporter